MSSSIQVKILFFLIKSRLNSNGEAPLFCRLTANKSNSRFSVGVFIPPSVWSQDKQQVLGKSEFAKGTNLKILSISKKIRDVEALFIKSQQEYSILDIVNKLQNKNNQPFKTLLQAYDYKFKQMQGLEGNTYSKGTIIKAKQLQHSVEQFLKQELKINDISISKVNSQFLLELEHFLKIKKNFSTASLNKTLQKLKSIMKLAFEFGVIETPAFPNHKFKHEKPKIIFLTITELEKLEYYQFAQNRLNLIRDIFLFSVYTGLHYSGAMSLTKANLIKGGDDKDWIVYTREKTGVEIHIPILDKAQQLINKFQNENELENKIIPKFSNQKINSYLKEIADILGIDKPLSHKIARKTFGSVLLYYNVPMKVVSKLMGHSSVLITEKHYADVELKKLGDEMGRIDKVLK
ncbi:MAG TPA: tyrosine-type recombinase/integrase [Edaphocola sp.]|nr:tyrosine-type recombinase/integrase [Edaphocola sp.]